MSEYTKYWHPKFKLAVDLIHLLYDLDDCVCGGLCHIVTDDDNIYDDCLDFVIGICEKEENKDRIDREISSTICKILKQMSFTQRAVLFEYLNSDIDIDIYNKDDLDTFLSINGTDIEDIVEVYDHRSTFYNTKEN